jgi:hypothetical protein
MRYFRKYDRVGENKISYVYTGGKYNYNHPKTIRDIQKRVR